MKIVYIVLGFIAMIIGSIGIVLPVLPTTPFLLVAAVCFAKGSKKLDAWFKKTKLYKNHLEDFVNNREMKMNTKVYILAFAISFCIYIAFRSIFLNEQYIRKNDYISSYSI